MFRRPSDLPNGQPLDDGYAQDAEQSAYDTDYADPADPYAGYDAPAETYTGDYDEDAAHAGDSACEDAPAEDAQQPDDEASASRRRTHRRAGGNPTSY